MEYMGKSFRADDLNQSLLLEQKYSYCEADRLCSVVFFGENHAHIVVSPYIYCTFALAPSLHDWLPDSSSN